MTPLLFIIVVVAVLAGLGALARAVGADSREEIDDSHARRSIRGSI